MRVQNEVKVVQAEAQKKIVAAEAEYKANELRTKALTPAVLEQMWIEKWDGRLPQYGTVPRSEEHTSELQSRQYLVCRLLLEKKKKTSYSLLPLLSLYNTLTTALPNTS